MENYQKLDIIFTKMKNQLESRINSIEQVNLEGCFRQCINSKSIDYFIYGGHYNYQLNIVFLTLNDVVIEFIRIHDEDEDYLLDIDTSFSETKLDMLIDIIVEEVDNSM